MIGNKIRALKYLTDIIRKCVLFCRFTVAFALCAGNDENGERTFDLEANSIKRPIDPYSIMFDNSDNYISINCKIH